MARWRCSGVVTGSKYLGEVEADTKGEAEEKALNLPTTFVGVCNHCADEVSDPAIESVIVELID